MRDLHILTDTYCLHFLALDTGCCHFHLMYQLLYMSADLHTKMVLSFGRVKAGFVQGLS